MVRNRTDATATIVIDRHAIQPYGALSARRLASCGLNVQERMAENTKRAAPGIDRMSRVVMEAPSRASSPSPAESASTPADATTATPSLKTIPMTTATEGVASFPPYSALFTALLATEATRRRQRDAPTDVDDPDVAVHMALEVVAAH